MTLILTFLARHALKHLKRGLGLSQPVYSKNSKRTGTGVATWCGLLLVTMATDSAVEGGGVCAGACSLLLITD